MSDIVSHNDHTEYNGYNDENTELMKKIENAYDTYRLSELFLKDVNGDYAKQKIARLRYEFARHELSILLEEAGKKGIKLVGMDVIKRYLNDL